MTDKKPRSTTRSEFAKCVGSKYPVLRKKLQKCGGWIYSEVASFAEFINDSIKASDHHTVDQAMALAESIYESADAGLRNAFHCDFFEVLDLRHEYGARVFANMTDEFQENYLKAQAYIGTPFGTKKT